MRNPIGPFMVTTLLLITFLLLTNYVYGKSKSEWLSDNTCMIKVLITQKCLDSECLISETTKEEVLKCSDGYDGPSYWELFAQFYYTDLTIEPYCRHFARPDHPFKTPGTVCLSENGVWREE